MITMTCLILWMPVPAELADAVELWAATSVPTASATTARADTATTALVERLGLIVFGLIMALSLAESRGEGVEFLLGVG
jgi:hypothetical protein